MTQRAATGGATGGATWRVWVVAVAVAGATLGGVWSGFGQREPGVARAALAEVRVQGGGASFPKSIYLRWASDYSGRHPDVRVEYTSQGSGAGIAGITNKTLDFGASDAPLSRKEREAIKDGEVLQIPSVAGAVVIVCNVPGVEKQLNLTGELVAEIYLGKITRWNDAKLAAVNPEVKLPDMPIAPVYRADASGTSYVFTSYLATQSPAFVKELPPTKQFQPQVGQAEKGNEGVSNRVRSVPGAVGYVELTYAMNEKLSSAAIRNKAGHFVSATTQSVSKAGAKAEKLIDPIWNSSDEGAYPISSFTYLLIYKDLGYMGGREKAQAVLGFMRYALGEGQQAAEGLFFAPLPDAVKAKATAALDSVTFNGTPLK